MILLVICSFVWEEFMRICGLLFIILFFVLFGLAGLLVYKELNLKIEVQSRELLASQNNKYNELLCLLDKNRISMEALAVKMESSLREENKNKEELILKFFQELEKFNKNVEGIKDSLLILGQRIR